MHGPRNHYSPLFNNFLMALGVLVKLVICCLVIRGSSAKYNVSTENYEAHLKANN
jgi:hypothetical protein